MTWSDIETDAVRLPADEIRARLSHLVGSPQFVALVALAMADVTSAAAIVGSPKASTDHGKLAHAAGALYQSQIALERLKGLIPRG